MSNVTPRIYVACLAAYNNGKLHGAWIDLEQHTTPEEIQQMIDLMLKASPEPRAEEWAIHDSEGLGDISEHERLEDVSARAALVSEHGPLALALLKGHASDVDDAKRMLEECYEGEFKSLEDWAENYLDDTGMFSGVSDTLKNYFDFERFGRDAELGGDIFTIDGEDVGYRCHVFRNC